MCAQIHFGFFVVFCAGSYRSHLLKTGVPMYSTEKEVYIFEFHHFIKQILPMFYSHSQAPCYLYFRYVNEK